MTAIAFILDKYRITDTRSKHEDTNFATVSVTVGKAPAITRTRAMGDQNNGTFTVGLSVVAEIPPDEDVPVVFSYVILNNGHGTRSAVEKALDETLATLGATASDAATKAAGAAAGAVLGAALGTAAVPVLGTAIGALAGWVTGTVGDFLFANCDGVVATGMRVFTARQLVQETLGGHKITETVEHPGASHPGGCRKSHYITTTSISAG